MRAGHTDGEVGADSKLVKQAITRPDTAGYWYRLDDKPEAPADRLIHCRSSVPWTGSVPASLSASTYPSNPPFIVIHPGTNSCSGRDSIGLYLTCHIHPDGAGRYYDSGCCVLTLLIQDDLSFSFHQMLSGGVAGWWLQQDKPHLHPILLIILLHISLGVSSLQRQIIPSTTNPCVPCRSALHPPRCQDLQASQHPATPAFLFLAS
ncbi:unnamed protein product [Pleuronectes platessa]|uniref:Uncharacterized protein n=1 Tax=Pleuronectes platessa TaxID=8262 RepID=A0A9N7VHR3_PLEPL|nr:unnamed protein product [Pleuronectes platessa]